MPHPKCEVLIKDLWSDWLLGHDLPQSGYSESIQQLLHCEAKLLRKHGVSVSLLAAVSKVRLQQHSTIFFFKEQGLCLLAAISKVRLQHSIDLLMGRVSVSLLAAISKVRLQHSIDLLMSRVSVSLLAANSKVHLQQHSTDLLMSRVSVSLFAAVSKECPQEQSKMYATSTEQNH